MKKLYLLIAISACAILNAQTELRILEGMGTRLYDVNNQGKAVHPGGYYDFTTNQSSPIEAEAQSTNRINNNEDVAGNMVFVSNDGNIDQPAYRKNGVWNAIGYFPGDVPGNSWFGNANDISNNSKYVTGQMTAVSISYSYPFIYDTDSNTLTKITGDNLWDHGRGVAINDFGYIAGWVDRDDLFNAGTFRVPVYFDQNGNIHYIDFDTPEYGEASDINNAGKVVGYKSNKAFIYDINTNEYLSFGDTSEYTSPVFTSISENGIVLGYAGNIGSRDAIIYHQDLEKPMLLKKYLIAKGINITTFDGALGTGMGISNDGLFVTGFDNTIPPLFAAGWIAYLDGIPKEPGCLDAPNGLFPEETITPTCDGSDLTITNQSATGQYSLINLTAGKEYTFSSSIGTDYITIANENGNEVLAYGIGSISWIPNEDQTVRFYLHLDDTCNSSEELRTKTLSCDTPTGCQWTITVEGDGFGDEVSWSLKNTNGTILLSGTGYSGPGYYDSQSIIADGPLEFYIESIGMFADNTPSYTISNGTEVLISDTLPGGDEITISDLNCETLALDDLNSKNIKIFPNPVTEILNIDSNQKIKSVRIYNITGQMVLEKNEVSNKQINVSSLKTGTYVINIVLQDGKKETFKLIKK